MSVVFCHCLVINGENGFHYGDTLLCFKSAAHWRRGKLKFTLRLQYIYTDDILYCILLYCWCMNRFGNTTVWRNTSCQQNVFMYMMTG